METKQLYEKVGNEFKPINPSVSLDELVDKETDLTLGEILIKYNHLKVNWKGDVNSTRKEVPVKYRRNGLYITYNNGTNLITEYYVGNNNSITTETWTNDNNWKTPITEDWINANMSKLKPAKDSVGYEQLTPALRQLVNQNTNVTNYPDDEDLTSQDNLLKFKDREYNEEEFSGKGYVILRKNLKKVNGVTKNILEQSMINKKNTIYEIRYDFDLNGEEINIPENCVLKFEGGGLNNGILSSNDLNINSNLNKILNNISFKGNHIIPIFYADWFGLKNDTIIDSDNNIILGTDNSELIEKVITNLSKFNSYNFCFNGGVYYFSREIKFITKNLNPWKKIKSCTVNIFGIGKDATSLIFTSDNGISMIYNDDNTDVITYNSIHDLQLINYKNNTLSVCEKYIKNNELDVYENKGYAIKRTGCYTSDVYNVIIRNFYAGIYCEEQYGSVSIHNNFIYNTIYGIVILSNSNCVNIKNCSVIAYDVSYYLKNSNGYIDTCVTELFPPKKYQTQFRSIAYYVSGGNWTFEKAYSERMYVSRYVVNKASLIDNNGIIKTGVSTDNSELSDNVFKLFDNNTIIATTYYIETTLENNLFKGNVIINKGLLNSYFFDRYGTYQIPIFKLNIIGNNSPLYYNNIILNQSIIINDNKTIFNSYKTIFSKCDCIPIINIINHTNFNYDDNIQSISPTKDILIGNNTHISSNKNYNNFIKTYSRYYNNDGQYVSKKLKNNKLKLNLTEDGCFINYEQTNINNEIKDIRSCLFTDSALVIYKSLALPNYNKTNIINNTNLPTYDGALFMDNNYNLFIKTFNGAKRLITMFDVNSINDLDTNVLYNNQFVFDKSSNKLLLYKSESNSYIAIDTHENKLTKGTTAQRPTNVSEGFEYYDSTLKKKILWNGTAWVNLDGTALS